MTTLLRALLFDFDGLILDTETPEMKVWTQLYAEYGFEFPLARGVQNVGLWGNSAFDPVAYLHELTHDSLDMAALCKRHRDESAVLIGQEPVRPGVEEMMHAGRQRGLRLAVASSSPRYWVVDHLTRLGLIERFDAVITGDDVPPGRVKPEPDIYIKALEALEAAPHAAIAFEDSPHGVTAAQRAGVFAVAVPNPTTARLNLDHADLVLGAVAALPLDELARRAAEKAARRPMRPA